MKLVVSNLPMHEYEPEMGSPGVCFVLIGYKTAPEAPILVAANREERYARKGIPPSLDAGPPRVLCGRDPLAGGTWLGVNEFGLLVAVTNRYDRPAPANPTSRGLLCRTLLHQTSAREATATARREVESLRYAGVNVLAMDPDYAAVVHGGGGFETTECAPGIHVLTNTDLNDPGDPRVRIAKDTWNKSPSTTAEQFLAQAKDVCRMGPIESGEIGILLRWPDRGTVSSTLIALGIDPKRSRYLHADGPPDRVEYADLSGDLQKCLASTTRIGTR